MVSLRGFTDGVQQFLPVSERLRESHRARIEDLVHKFTPPVEEIIERHLPPLPVVTAPPGTRAKRELLDNADLVHEYTIATGESRLLVYAGMRIRGQIRFPPSKHTWDYRVLHELGHHVWSSTPGKVDDGPKRRLWNEGFADYFALYCCAELHREEPDLRTVAPIIYMGRSLVWRAIEHFSLDPLEIPRVWHEIETTRFLASREPSDSR